MSLVPKEALRYSPDSQSTFTESSGNIERLIFSNQDYKPSELSSLSSLNKLLLSSVHLDSSEKLRFLYAARWNIQEALSLIYSHMQWYKNWPSYQAVFSQISRILNSGGVYIHGRDKKFRPIICIIPSLLCLYPIELIIKTIFYICEYSKERLFLPGRIENFILLIDLEDFYACQALSTVINILLAHYPCRLAKCFIFNYSRELQIYLNMLSKVTLNKISFAKDNNLFDLCSPSQIEKKFGGHARNVTNYWPPSFPPTSFLITLSMNHSESSSLISNFKQLRKESWLTSSVFKDEAWDRCEADFSIINPDIDKNSQKIELVKIKNIQKRRLSDEMTRFNNKAKHSSFEKVKVEPGCCVETTCMMI